MRTAVFFEKIVPLSSLLIVGCSSPRVEPLMPTAVLFNELYKGPLDHIPEPQRWNPRRVYYATTRARDDDLQRIDYGNGESARVSVGLTLVGFGGPDIFWTDLNVVTVSSNDGALKMARRFMGGGWRIGLRTTDVSPVRLAIVGRSRARIDATENWFSAAQGTTRNAHLPLMR